MSQPLRLAVGTIQPWAQPQLPCWGLLNLFSAAGLRVQHFQSQACFCRVDGATASTGVGSRHLDSWLMSRDVCREVFARGAADCELAVVEGSFIPAEPAAGGSLETLCQWLQLPRIVVLNVSRQDGCQLPPRPPAADGLLLDEVGSLAEFCRMQTILESMWGIPVLGGLEREPQLRAAFAALPAGGIPDDALCRALGQRFARLAQVGRLRELARRTPDYCVQPNLFRSGAGPARPTVAVAYDEVFNCYFPDTLDLLELRGARIVDFSPLNDEALPEDTDVVYIGCGHPERHAAALAENYLMTNALRSHVFSGKQVYAEGGGLAYLCRHAELPDGQRLEMAGALPAAVRMNPEGTFDEPVEFHLAQDSWIGAAGHRLRGYLNSYWQLEPLDEVDRYADLPGHGLALAGRLQTLGSRVHLNFAHQGGALGGFFGSRSA